MATLKISPPPLCFYHLIFELHSNLAPFPKVFYKETSLNFWNVPSTAVVSGTFCRIRHFLTKPGAITPTPTPLMRSRCAHLSRPGSCVQLETYIRVDAKSAPQTSNNNNNKKKSSVCVPLAANNASVFSTAAFYEALQCHCIKGALSRHESRHTGILQPHYLGEVPSLSHLYPPDASHHYLPLTNSSLDFYSAPHPSVFCSHLLPAKKKQLKWICFFSLSETVNSVFLGFFLMRSRHFKVHASHFKSPLTPRDNGCISVMTAHNVQLQRQH